MATTTNFGWTTPDNTDLVKDGALAIRTLGSAIDTTLVDLKGGTTGQVLSKASNTDMDFTWVAQDDSNAIQNAIVDAKGDLITATGADTPARLAVGTNEHRLVADSAAATGLKYVADTTNYAIAAKGDLLAGTAADTVAALTVGTDGHVLTADSTTATGLKWAAASAGFDLISTTAFSAVSSQSINDVFSSTYNNYKIVIHYDGSADAALRMRLRVSGSDNSSSNYGLATWNVRSGAQAAGGGFTETSWALTDAGGSVRRSGVSIDVYDPFNTANTSMTGLSAQPNGFSSQFVFMTGGSLSVTTSYTGFTIYPASGTITGTVSVYGYRK